MILDQRFPDRKEIGLAVCCDWHLGSKTCNTRAVQTWVDMIRDNQWYVLLMGDLTENATIGSVGSVFEQTITPQEQVDEVVEILRPIKDYILGNIDGNHGARSTRIAGLNPDQHISSLLKIPYFGYSIDGRIQVGNGHWKIHGHHGASGGITRGAKLNALFKMTQVVRNADLYVGAHTHAAIADFVNGFEIVLNRGRVQKVKTIQHLSGCGSTLEYEGSYAEAKGYPPASMCQVVHFLGDRQRAGRDGAYRLGYRRDPVWL